MQWINYHHLYYFYVIATEGTITNATKLLKLAQSTLSAQLKQFEETIGYQLFERKGRQLILTDVGKRVFDYAHEIFSLGEELRDSLSDFENSLRTSVQIGVMDSVPKKLSRDIVRIAHQEHSAKVRIVEGDLKTLMLQLTHHKVDLVLANDKPPSDDMTRNFHARLIGELAVVFATTPRFANLKEGLPRSLNDQPMILPGEGSPLRTEVIEHLKIKHVHPAIVSEVNDLELQKMLTLDGNGVSAFPIIAIEEELASGQLIRLSETPICHESLWLIASHRLVHNPIAKILMDSFRP